MTETDGDRRCTIGESIAAWSVHAVTATGILCGIFALTAIADDNPKVALLWMMLAMVVDGVDGAAARKVDVKRVTPSIDGHMLDLLIDFVCCCVAPAVFLYRFGQLPQTIAVVGVAMVMLSSLYWMSRSDQESDDNYFNGFPSMWNLVVTGFFVLHTSQAVNLFVIVLLSALSFSDVKFLHPVRVRDLRPFNLPIMVAWIGAMSFLIFDHDGAGWAHGVIYFAVAHQVFITIRRTFFVADANLDPVILKTRPH